MCILAEFVQPEKPCKDNQNNKYVNRLAGVLEFVNNFTNFTAKIKLWY